MPGAISCLESSTSSESVKNSALNTGVCMNSISDPAVP